jgi:DNA-binding CsgD family transcriptional regulator
MKMWGESMIAGMEKKHVINLTPKERRRCLAIVSKGRNKASMIRRAHILLKSDEGKIDREISEMLYTSEETVRRRRGIRASLIRGLWSLVRCRRTSSCSAEVLMSLFPPGAQPAVP